MQTFQVNETRRITFRLPDFASALAIPDVGGIAKLDGAAPYTIVAHPDQRRLHLRSLIRDAKPFVMEELAVCALLMRLCGHMKIPIPRGASKTVEFDVESLTLILHLDAERDVVTRGLETVTAVAW